MLINKSNLVASFKKFAFTTPLVFSVRGADIIKISDSEINDFISLHSALLYFKSSKSE